MLELTQVSKRFNEGQPNEVAGRARREPAPAAGPGHRARRPQRLGQDHPADADRLPGAAHPRAASPARRLLSGLPEQHLAQVRRQTFGFAFQRFNLIPGLSALDNVMLPAYPLGLPHAELVERARR
jgi:putative ABC transport system ATP-binding protein